MNLSDGYILECAVSGNGGWVPDCRRIGCRDHIGGRCVTQSTGLQPAVGIICIHQQQNYNLSINTNPTTCFSDKWRHQGDVTREEYTHRFSTSVVRVHCSMFKIYIYIFSVAQHPAPFPSGPGPSHHDHTQTHHTG